MGSFALKLDAPFYSGSAVADPDSRYDVALAGHSYMLDWSKEGEFRRESVPVLKDQQDQSNRPGENSISPNGLWRRSVESWHHGAGQSWLDRADTDPFRFGTSKGVDPWTQYGLSLLNDTSQAQSTASTNLNLAVAGGALFYSAGNIVFATATGNTILVGCSGTPAVAVTALASDGSTCYAGYGAQGIYKATGGTSVFASYVTGTVGLVRYVKGRIIAANANSVYNPIAAGALPAALYTHPNASWTWTDVGEGPGHIFLAGYAGDRSMVYKTAVKADGTALDVPSVAVELPDGEIARSITGYLGYVVIGTDKGARFAVPDANGNLTLGSLIPTPSPVYCGEGQDRFVWYGLTNYDGASTGLGRLDLSTFTTDLTPAYASDLMATGQGTVQSVATYLNKRWFTVSGLGLYAETAGTKVATGTITGGRVGYGLPEKKNALYLNVRHDKLVTGASVAVSLAVDNQTPVGVGSSAVVSTSEPNAPFNLSNVYGNDFEWTLTLAGAVTLRTVTLRADPTPERNEYIYVPILLDSTVGDTVGEPVAVYDEWAYLNDLRDTRRVVTYQEGVTSKRVVVEDTQWRPRLKTRDGQFYQGTYLAKLKGV